MLDKPQTPQKVFDFLGTPRFIADAMLGSLAKWLRILGFDTLYFRVIDDNEIIRIARQQQRTILTRDTNLARSRKIYNCIFIHSNDVYGQLKEVLRIVCSKQYAVGVPRNSQNFWGRVGVPRNSQNFWGRVGSEESRCAKCNGELMSADKESVENDVPEHVFLNFNSFFKCKDCGKVYWEGSHKKLMNAKIKEILQEIGVPRNS